MIYDFEVECPCGEYWFEMYVNYEPQTFDSPEYYAFGLQDRHDDTCPKCGFVVSTKWLGAQADECVEALFEEPEYDPEREMEGL